MIETGLAMYLESLNHKQQAFLGNQLSPVENHTDYAICFIGDIQNQSWKDQRSLFDATKIRGAYLMQPHILQNSKCLPFCIFVKIS